MNNILWGYMGSGKSTIGRLLAQKTDKEFIDLDHYIQEKEQSTVGQIFENKGEIYFRKLETKYLQEVLDLREPAVISLGGGTPCYGNNMEFIKNSGHKTIYIYVTVQELSARLWKARFERPLLKYQDSPEKLEDFIRKHLFERSFYYNQAQIKLSIDGRSASKAVDELVARLV